MTSKLLKAAKNGDIRGIEKLLDGSLLRKRISVDVKNSEGDTALIVATAYIRTTSNLDTVRFLLDRGADVNTKNNDGIRVLMLASLYGQSEAVKLVLDRGANINAKNNYEETALILASDNGYLEIVQLLLDKGADINAKNNKGETSLMLASDNGYLEIVQLLLDKGADPFEKSSDGFSVIEYCGTDVCEDMVAGTIWERLYTRDKDTAAKYAQRTNIPKDVWVLILLNKRQQLLCQYLSSPQNREVLKMFAVEIDIPITEDMTKAKLCGIISRHLVYWKVGNVKPEINIKQLERYARVVARESGLDPNRPLQELLDDLSLMI